MWVAAVWRMQPGATKTAIRSLGFLIALSLSACGPVRLAPDYSADLVKKVADLRDSVLTFARQERWQYGTEKGRYAANETTYDDWFVRVQSMTEDSSLLDSGIDCTPLAGRLQNLVHAAGGLEQVIQRSGSTPDDFNTKYTAMLGQMKTRGCQTQMFFDLQARVIHMAAEHKLDDDELAANPRLQGLNTALKNARSQTERQAASDAIAAFYSKSATVKWGPPLAGGVFQIGEYPLMIGGVLGSIAAIQPVLEVKKP